MKFRQGGPARHYIVPAALSVDFLGEGSRHRSSRFSLTSPFLLAQLRTMLKEQHPWLSRCSGSASSGFRPRAFYKAKRASLRTERADRS